jgi:hypothetical protein
VRDRVFGVDERPHTLMRKKIRRRILRRWAARIEDRLQLTEAAEWSI